VSCSQEHLPAESQDPATSGVHQQRLTPLTEKARTWTRESDGARLTSSEAGVLNGFPAGFPWSGSRSRQFLQAANVVAPQVAAALLAEVAV
jgi:site-specific DNA-cytosine methylase